MKKANKREMADDLRPEYDFSKLRGGVRGKYAKRFQQGTNLVILSSYGHGVGPMQVLLQPTGDTNSGSLQDLYDKAVSEATELFIVSAYLTEWRPKQSISMNCQQLSFIVGTNFGITRKAACRSVLHWLPKQFKSDFLAADHISGFHPKLVMWKDKNGNCHIVLGSSNLTQAAFTTNYEANVFTPLSDGEYNTIKAWVYEIKLGCSPISEDWIAQYKENIQQTKAQGKKKPPVKLLPVPLGSDIDQAILERREQHRAFQEISEKLAELIRQCAKGQIANLVFYEKMMRLWGHHKSRLQGVGFERRGKHGNWQGVCKSILSILDAAPSLAPADLDDLVRKERDQLAKADNPNRGAWMSEILCHYLPGTYPIENKPVRTWLQHINYRHPRKASEGAKYIDLARKLRLTVKQKKNKAQNLLELDHGIWKWYDNNRRNPVA